MSEQNAQIIAQPTLPSPILITGASRSGTSMSAGIIHRCGAFGGRTDPGFENIEIRTSTVKPFTGLVGCDPRWQYPLPDTRKLPPLAGLVRRLESVMKFDGYRYGAWYYKSPGIALTWPVWSNAFGRAKWVIVRRKDEDIYNSCMKTGYMNAHDSVEGWTKWLDHFKVCFKEIHANVLNVREIWPTRFVEGDFSEIRDVIEWLGLTWKEDKIRAFVKPELWRSYDGQSDVS